MSNREDDKDESAHSAQSQDTELIDGNSSYLDTTNNSPIVEGAIRSSNGTHNSSLLVHTGHSHEHSLLDFPAPNASTTTACSTPHESKRLGSTTKRRFTISSDDTIIKRQRLLEKENLDRSNSRSESDSIPNIKSDPESFQEVSSSSSDVKPFEKKAVIEYAEANSSTSSSSKLISNSSSDSFERSMVRKHRSPAAFPIEKSPLIKAYSEDFNESDIAALKAKNLELEAQIRHLQHQLVNKNREESKDNSKEFRGKHCSEKLLCTVSYVYDDAEGEITSMSIKQVSKIDLFDHKQHRLSISSGSLADSSGSEIINHWIQKGPTLASYSSSSSVTSSSSSIPSQAGKGVFLVPQIPEPKKHWTYKYPKTCVCHCYCSAVVDYLAKQHAFCATPETLSSSSENIKTDSQDIATLNIEQQSVPSQTPYLDSGKAESSKSPLMEQKFRSRSSIYIPTSTNLPVFAKWPSNSFCYPGIIENATEDTWHKSSHLEVRFCDGTVKKTLSENLFPAYLLPSGTEISFEKDDICETAKLVSIERQLNNQLVCIGETMKDAPEKVQIPFEKIFLSDYCYKGLKKTSTTSLTPQKTPRFSISTANVTEGKRTRKVVKFDSYGQKNLSSSSGRKTKPKGKRARSTTDTSGSDVPKSDKKRVRSWSQKKSALRKTLSEETATTPHCSLSEKGQVSRKLYEETPSCSKTRGESPGTLLLLSALTDTESSVKPDVNFELIKGSYLDTEKALDISRRPVKSKSLSKRTGAGSNDDKLKGPIPEKQIFSDYNFVLTHSNPKPIKKQEIIMDSCSEDGSGTDFEDYYNLPDVPFDLVRVKEQILSGGGNIYQSLIQVPTEEHDRTLVISNSIVETPNYLLAVSLGIPVFRHDLIINACDKEKHVSLLLGNAMRLPTGRSIDTGRWILNAPAKPLADYICALCLSSNQSTTNFWWHLLTNSGAKVINNTDTRSLNRTDVLSFIVGDKFMPLEVLVAARHASIPVVSTLWVMQTVINGRIRPYNSHADFTISVLTSGSEQTESN